ncbi:beta strand repeat-containing protein [Desulfobulbus propionicus DSM 2032]|uniref:Beta strand repeat-containing protein n=1 Tax=Desulfobulbus propionicus (strain ATCC 33891 / DSM 2032 / VKM B-1956 / 1pr3) TaxID=577650 RepID=A0A7U3YJ83_DESPD|nr:beta strand repeat-containing protein [Desulfobulbus propionicus]ADW16384.1 beta strand repeat-containing protein [Desulfobulbus propionicus DSM 2032]
MIDTNETLGFLLEDFGVEALINGGPKTIVVDPFLDGSTEFNGETIDHSGPFAIAAVADTEALAAGDQGDTLTINGTDFTLLAIDPDGQGGVVLRLEEQP